MKTPLVLLMLVIGSLSSSFAQVSFGGGAHSAVYLTRQDQSYGFAYGFGLHGDVNLLPAIAARLDLDYYTFPGRQSGTANAIGIAANILGKIPTGSLKPYGIAGFGLQTFKVSETTFSNTVTCFTLNYGGGVELSIGKRTKIYFDVKRVLIFAPGETASFIPVTLGMSF
jgi:hypothetical protein